MSRSFGSLSHIFTILRRKTCSRRIETDNKLRSRDYVRIPLLVRYVNELSLYTYTPPRSAPLAFVFYFSPPEAHRILGYHVPATRRRDEFYAKVENERAKKAGII